MTRENYQIRWRGKVSGPFSFDALQTMLARGEISLMHELLVDGQWISFEELVSKMRRESVARPPAPRPVSAPEHLPPKPKGPPPIPPEELLYVAKGGQQQGPYTKSVVRQLATAGVVSGDDLAWRDGMSEWMPLSRLVPDLPRPPAVTPAFSLPASPPFRSEQQSVPVQPPPSEEGGAGSGAVAGGYICSLISLGIFPPFFSLAAFICGIVALVKGKVGHGVAILLLSLIFGFLGMAFGAAAFSK